MVVRVPREATLSFRSNYWVKLRMLPAVICVMF